MQDENKKLRRELAEGYGHAAGARPEYAASYEKELSGVYDSMKNRPEFSYDANSDGLYRQYRNGYIQRGRMAMKDTMGQAAALTGGYGSSYAESAAQQQYDVYLQQLGDIVPELYTLAYSRYQDEGEALKERYDMLSGLRDREFGEYTDALDRYEAAQAAAYQREADEREREEKQREQEYQYGQSEAAARAKCGDFGGYAALYGEETANQMKNYWIASNPDAAYNMGLISAERYYSMTGGFAPGQAAQSAVSSGSSGRGWYPSTAPDGRDAKVVQRELRNRGYNIAVDGAWGPKSQKAWEQAMGGMREIPSSAEKGGRNSAGLGARSR